MVSETDQLQYSNFWEEYCYEYIIHTSRRFSITQIHKKKSIFYCGASPSLTQNYMATFSVSVFDSLYLD